MNKQSTYDDFFTECYQNYREYIKNYIASRIYHPHEAEDLAHDVFVRLWEHRAFVNKGTVYSLLFTIARNIVTDRIRHYYRQEDYFSYIYNNERVYAQNAAEDKLYCEDLRRLHHTAVQALPLKRRQIYKLSFHHELLCPAIAGKLSLSPRTVEGQLLLARKSIRTYLKKEYSKVG